MAFSVYELFLNLYLLSLGFDVAFIGLANTARGIASLMSMSWDAGWSTAPLVSGLVQVRAGFTPLFVATTIVYTLALTAVYGFFVRPARGPSPGKRT